MSDEILQCSNRTRADVWDKLYGAEFASRFYQKLGNDFLRKHNCLRRVTLALGGGAVIPAIVQFLAFSEGNVDPIWAAASGLIGVGLAVVSWWSVGEDYARKTSVAMSISKSCGKVTDELSGLLSEMDLYRTSDSGARERLNHLSERVRIETYSSEQVGVAIDENSQNFKEAEKESYRHMEHLKEAYSDDV